MVLTQLDAVGPGQYQVEQDQRGLLGADDLGEIAMVGGDQRGIARFDQRVADMAQGLRVVVDHGDAVGLTPLPGRFGGQRGEISIEFALSILN